MIIVKIGGGKDINVEGIVKDLAEIDDKLIIVHGANYYRDTLAERLGKPKRVVTSVSGYSSVFSDQEAMDVLIMAYAGLRNKRIVELCQKYGVNAVGLSGVDGQTIQGKRNRGIRVKQGQKLVLLRDFSGKPHAVNQELLELLLDNGYVPVICVPIIDETKTAINAENDDILNELQKVFHAEKVIHFIEAPGFLDDKDDPSSLVEMIRKDELKDREEQVEGRMKRKLLALRRLFERGACSVVIADGRTENPIKDALSEKGTTIK
jgi:acetylglutamate/LysW-gamma-L-alpha-aminoadipate kinase